MNHTQEAKRLLAEAISDKYVRSPAGFDASTLVTQRAQVHATLALAEQQRIANLIALSNAEQADYLTEPITEEEQQKLLEDYGASGRLRPEIREALELGDLK